MCGCRDFSHRTRRSRAKISKYRTTHKLKGPYSPLEVKMHCKVHSLLGNVLEIEEDSVNSIILEDQPCNNHERVLVAAYVRTNGSNEIDSS